MRHLPISCPGSVVLHQDGDVGIVIGCYEDSWEVKFLSGHVGNFKSEALVDPDTFSWIPISPDLNPTGLSAQDKLNLLEPVVKNLEAGRFSEADETYKSCCVSWWERGSYAGVRGHFERAFKNAETAKLQAERRRLQVEVIDRLRQGEIEEADSIFREKCRGWWGAADYEGHRGCAVAINEVVSGYSDCSLMQLNELFADERLELSAAEIAALKLPKLDARLARLGLPLDQAQRLACARPEDRLLIRARAGSGKTRTLAAIAALAIEDEKLNPDQVMILAFNKKAAEEIGERVRTIARIPEYRNARTFHSLAHQLCDHNGRKLVFDDGGLQPSHRKQSQFIERVIHAVLNPAFREKLYEFFRSEVEQIERIGSNLEGEEYLAFRRAMTDYSLAGDNVKSNGEKFIADFLFEHGIPYEYEKAWSWKKEDRLGESAYRPDFSLLDGGTDLIWEHWGINPDDHNAELPKWWKTSTRDYRDQIDEKRRFWGQRGIRLIETHAGMLHGGRAAFEEKLVEMLGRQGIACRKLNHAELVKRVAEAPRTISRMSGLFLGFISRAKTRGWSVEQMADLIARNPDSEPRNRLFHELAVRVYAEYEKLLVEEQSWDFNDMLISAAQQVKECGGAAEVRLGHQESVRLSGLRYILIDEFQDFSELYYQLVRAILDVNPGVRIVAVGDDWQAINSFAGAQLSFFENFDKYFDGAGTVNIATNRRSVLEVVGAGNKIMDGYGQPAQAKPEAWMGHVEARDRNKVWVGDDGLDRLCKEAATNDVTGKIDFELARVLKACSDFISDSVFEQEGAKHLRSVLLLARTGRVYGLEHRAFKERLLAVLDQHPKLQDIANDINLEVMTTHKAKGKEADTVIVLEVTAKQFPKVHADNQLFGPFGISVKDTLAEERRLFYVAVTRAEHRLMLLSETENKSPFLEELGISNGTKGLIPLARLGERIHVQLGETANTIQQRLKKCAKN